MNPHLQRALLLFDQSRHELAEAELRQALATDPDDALTHAVLALCLAKRESFQEATTEARQAIHLSPDLPFAHYALADILQDRGHHEEALAANLEAIRLDSSDPDYFAQLSAIHFSQSRWKEALSAAEQGLELEPEHIGCTNLRAMALVKLGRKAEAGATIDAALTRNPENSITHANQGWALLEQRNPTKALEHFREALRLNPENEWAREGIVTALKAQNFVYALALRYFLWMTKLSPKAQWGILLGGYFGNRFLGSLARSYPELSPWVWPVRIVYLAFVVLTWTADPLFNLLLRLNRFGKLALSREQIVASNWIGMCLLLALLALAGAVAMEFEGAFALAPIVFALLIIPLAGTFRCSKGWPRRVMAGYTAFMALAGISGLALFFLAESQKGEWMQFTLATGGPPFALFLLGAMGSPWVANILIMQRPKR